MLSMMLPIVDGLLHLLLSTEGEGLDAMFCEMCWSVS